VERAHDLGPQVAWLAITDGMPVYDPGGEQIGVAEHPLEAGGIFEGVLVHTRPLPGRHLVADPGQIADIRERGIVLAVGRDALHDLDAEQRAWARDRHAGDLESPIEATLRRAWDWLAARR
jgi:hypothetical protein